MTVLSNQCQCKTAFAAATSAKTRGSDKQKQSQLYTVFPFIFMCDYTYILILKGIVSSDQLVGVRHHLAVVFCINIPYILQGVTVNVSKTGNTKSFSKTQFMVHQTE